MHPRVPGELHPALSDLLAPRDRLQPEEALRGRSEAGGKGEAGEDRDHLESPGAAQHKTHPPPEAAPGAERGLPEPGGFRSQIEDGRTAGGADEPRAAELERVQRDEQIKSAKRSRGLVRKKFFDVSFRLSVALSLSLGRMLYSDEDCANASIVHRRVFRC